MDDVPGATVSKRERTRRREGAKGREGLAFSSVFFESLRAFAPSRSLLPALFAVALGAAMTLCVRGYQFGESNHAVYLIDALRRSDPTLLKNDWWTQSTLQYHFVFNALTAGLMRLGILEPAFLIGYLALAVLLHVAWRKLVLRLGGTDGTYLLSVVLYYLLAGGVGLGMYHFLQDSAFLPSNISNVAMLWGVYFLIAGTPASAGVCLGIAGLFHINHALAGIGLWAGASLFEGRRNFTRGWVIGSAALIALCALQIVPALRIVLTRTGKLPLAEFVDLFVRLRHPHHFDPRAWHWGVWLAFLAPLPLATVAYKHAPASAERRRARVVFALFAAMLAFALIGAGFWFVSETLVQLNLYRFSIYSKLLSCVALAWLIEKQGRIGRSVVTGSLLLMLLACGFLTMVWPQRHNVHAAFFFLAVALTALAAPYGVRRGLVIALLAAIALPLVAYAVGRRQFPLGIRIEGLEGDDADYRSVAAWARDNTPVDAVFLVPPDEESFRLRARRAIVVNFKGVPQLSAELPEWRDRLLSVLDLRSTQDLLALPRPMGRTLQAIRARYSDVPPERLFAVAANYGARYVVLTRRAGPAHDTALVYSDTNGRYFLYDLPREVPVNVSPAEP
jgi:hypothetical protein